MFLLCITKMLNILWWVFSAYYTLLSNVQYMNTELSVCCTGISYFFSVLFLCSCSLPLLLLLPPTAAPAPSHCCSSSPSALRPSLLFFSPCCSSSAVPTPSAALLPLLLLFLLLTVLCCYSFPCCFSTPCCSSSSCSCYSMWCSCSAKLLLYSCVTAN